VDATDEIVTLDVTVAEEHPAMETPSVMNRDLAVVTDNHEVDSLDSRVGRVAVREVTPNCYLLAVGATHTDHLRVTPRSVTVLLCAHRRLVFADTTLIVDHAPRFASCLQPYRPTHTVELPNCAVTSGSLPYRLVGE
jgi:hypothetical protein